MAREFEIVDQAGQMFTSYTYLEKNVVVIKPNREYTRLDSSTSKPVMRPELESILGNRIADYVFDFRSVEYISAFALQEMIGFVKNLRKLEKVSGVPEHDSKPVAIIPSDRVLEVLQLSGFDFAFSIRS